LALAGFKERGDRENKMNKEKYFIGIDLGGMQKKTTGFCILEGKKEKIYLSDYCSLCRDIKSTQILKKIKPYLEKIEVIAIDGPLTQGKGKGLMRLFEKFLSTKIFRKERVNPLPPALRPEISFIGQKLARDLKEKGFVLDKNLIETFAKLDKKILPKKFIFETLKIKKLPCKTKNQKEAVICALLAWLHFNFKTRWLGYKDGFLFLPEMSFWKKSWRRKFYQAWMSRSRLKYRYLITDVFSK
jgi:predicted nuclease with RNAse H fold